MMNRLDERTDDVKREIRDLTDEIYEKEMATGNKHK